MRRHSVFPVASRILAASFIALAFLSTRALADIKGFDHFAPINSVGQPTAVGFDSTKTAFTLTDGGKQEATSAFALTPQRIAAFAVSFTYQTTKFGGGSEGGGDGLAFVLQNDPRNVHAIGETGNAVGYGNGSHSIRHSAAVRLGIYGGASESIAVDGTAEPYGDTIPVDLRSGHPIRITLKYDGGSITETFRDTITGDTFTETHALDIVKAVGGSTALVGFTGASGDSTAHQEISDLRFTELPPVPVALRKRVYKPIKLYTGLASYVDPFIGTANDGNTYPGAVAPFGMVQFSPDTRAPSIGYTYNERTIQGFSLTHMSGVGCDDFGDVFLTATTGPVKTGLADYQSPYSHRHESASPGYYSVTLVKHQINAELTATERAGLVRFTFPAGKQSNILIPISHTLTRTRSAAIRIVGDHEIEGKVESQSFCGASQYITVYFVMQFDMPFQKFGTFTEAGQTDGRREATQTENQPPIGAYVSYPGSTHRSVTARIGISFVDIAGARNNLQREVGTRGFDDIRKQTADTWERDLHAIEVTGGTPTQRTVFYTALYHSLLMPNIFSDSDGRYVGYDRAIHRVTGNHIVYANYSGWDIYRNEASLLALIAPQRMEDMCESIVLMYQQGGWFDRWPQANTYTNVMCGSPLTSFVATAWNYGLHGFDIKTAYEGMYKDATERAPGGKPYYGESNIAWMDKVGYIPDDKEGYGSVSQTEEDCYAYAALSQVAESLGKTADAASLRKRALNYRNLFESSTKFLRPRRADGAWVEPFNPTQEQGYVEGSAWHYRWLAPQDAAGLISLFGGDAAFNEQLDAFFAYPSPTWNDRYYNPYNETDLEAPFLYDFSGAPWKTQSRVRELLGEVYKTTPDGIPGNDDCGTMSAWAIFAMAGFYPTDPARPAFELCSPLFPKVIFHLGAPGKTFTVNAPTASESNVYIHAIRLGSSSLGRPWIKHSEIVTGGSMTVTLGHTPDKTWGSAPAVRPPSLSSP